MYNMIQRDTHAGNPCTSNDASTASNHSNLTGIYDHRAISCVPFGRSRAVSFILSLSLVTYKKEDRMKLIARERPNETQP